MSLHLVLLGWAVLAVAFAGLWLLQRRTRDAGIVDVGWAAGIGLLALLYAGFGEGLPARRALLAVMAAVWSGRLALYILRDRVLKGGEDGRYAALRESWGAAFERRIFGFFQAQAALSAAFSLPIAAAMASTRPLGWLDAAAAAIWAAAVVGESVADRQLEAHRSDPANRGRTCRRGLWRYSRHPNYFFEWLHWWTYAAAAVGSPWWWVAVAAPLVMLYFILFVTGIPPTEARAMASRGEDYRRYQRETSAFLPWFPRRQGARGR
jgi:steroid 5-alpha reductase family enzyme